MKAVKCPDNLDTFLVTATNGRRYTVKGGRITPHGSMIPVGVDGNLDPMLARLINVAVEAAATIITPGESA